MQSGVILVLFVMVRMIEYLCARVSKMWLLGEWGILLYSSPLDLVVLGVFCARFPPELPPREAKEKRARRKRAQEEKRDKQVISALKSKESERSPTIIYAIIGHPAMIGEVGVCVYPSAATRR